VLYSADGSVVWAAGTDGSGGVDLAMQDDGNLVLYNGEGTAVWSSGTMQGKSQASAALKKSAPRRPLLKSRSHKLISPKLQAKVALVEAQAWK